MSELVPVEVKAAVWAEIQDQIYALEERAESVALEFCQVARSFDEGRRRETQRSAWCCSAGDLLFRGRSSTTGDLLFRIDCTWHGPQSGWLEVPVAFMESWRLARAGKS